MYKNIILMSWIIVLFHCRTAAGDDDRQYWSTFKFNHALSDRDGISLLYEVYAREDMSDDYVYLAIPTYKRKLTHGFSLLGGGYFESVQKEGNTWNNVRSIFGGAVYRLAPGENWFVDYQVKLYYQLAPDFEWDYYRPRLSIHRRFGAFSLAAEDEMRVDLTGVRGTDFFRNRVFVTGEKKIGNSIAVGLGYIGQSDQIHDQWRSIHVLHTVFT